MEQKNRKLVKLLVLFLLLLAALALLTRLIGRSLPQQGALPEGEKPCYYQQAVQPGYDEPRIEPIPIYPEGDIIQTLPHPAEMDWSIVLLQE